MFGGIETISQVVIKGPAWNVLISEGCNIILTLLSHFRCFSLRKYIYNVDYEPCTPFSGVMIAKEDADNENAMPNGF